MFREDRIGAVEVVPHEPGLPSDSIPRDVSVTALHRAHVNRQVPRIVVVEHGGRSDHEFRRDRLVGLVLVGGVALKIAHKNLHLDSDAG